MDSCGSDAGGDAMRFIGTGQSDIKSERSEERRMQRGHSFGVYIVDVEYFFAWCWWAAFSETGKAVSEFSERRGQASLAPVAQACRQGALRRWRGRAGSGRAFKWLSHWRWNLPAAPTIAHTVLEAPLLTLALRYRPKPKALPGQAGVCVSGCAFCMDGLAPNAAPNDGHLSPIGKPAGKWTVRWLRLVGLRCCNAAVVDGAQSVSKRGSFQQVLGDE